ncbi:MAG: hypothetical protein K1X88_28410 [Nannocystaceae bacterium]|nr:hypothetical protein [Nannocystaceae bacterium]
MTNLRTRSRLLLLVTLASPLLGVACDHDESPTTESRSASPSDADGPPSPAHALCQLVGCTDAQAQALATLLPGDAHARPSEQTFAAANAALADAYAAADFDVDALAAWREAVHGAEDPALPIDAKTLVAVHDVLDADQRDLVADRLEQGGPFALMGGHHRGGEHRGHPGGKRGKGGKGPARGDKAEGDPGAHAAKAAAKLCEPLSCSDEQQEQIAAVLLKAANARHGRADRSDTDAAFAEAFRAEALALDTASAYLGGLAQAHTQHAGERDAVAVAIHHVLDASQRQQLAARIVTDGPRALGPGPRGRGHHGKGRPSESDQAAG